MWFTDSLFVWLSRWTCATNEVVTTRASFVGVHSIKKTCSDSDICCDKYTIIREEMYHTLNIAAHLEYLLIIIVIKCEKDLNLHILFLFVKKTGCRGLCYCINGSLLCFLQSEYCVCCILHWTRSPWHESLLPVTESEERQDVDVDELWVISQSDEWNSYYSKAICSLWPFGNQISAWMCVIYLLPFIL